MNRSVKSVLAVAVMVCVIMLCVCYNALNKQLLIDKFGLNPETSSEQSPTPTDVRL